MSVEGVRRRIAQTVTADRASVEYDEFVNRPTALDDGTPADHAYVTCTIARGAVQVSRVIDARASGETIDAEKALARAGLVALLRELADSIEALGDSVAPDAVQA